MISIIIGLSVGLIMGLTGAGGALIAIPLFLGLLGVTLKEATVLSLIVVILGALINLVGQQEKSNFKIALSFVFFGSLANWLFVGLKNIMPEIGIALLLSLIGVYSLWSVWTGNIRNEEEIQSPRMWSLALVGILLGLTTTLTGLGGGVLLVPILIKGYKFNYSKALPTSLLTITLISLTSLIMQWGLIQDVIKLQDVALLIVGVVVSALLLRFSLKWLKPKTLDQLRKSVFSIVTIYAIITVILKSL